MLARLRSSVAEKSPWMLFRILQMSVNKTKNVHTSICALDFGYGIKITTAANMTRVGRSVRWLDGGGVVIYTGMTI